VVFILDRSGSMQGWQMVAARRAVARMIDSLNHNDRFAVMAFDDRIEQPTFDGGRALVTATDRNRFVAVEFLAKVDARGGTEMEQPLAVAAATLQQSPMDRERVIVLATDGQVTGEDQILGRLTPMLQGTRVFTIGIDKGVNAAFLRRLANAGAGLFELVESEDRLDQVMSKVHGRIGMPVLSNLGLDGEGLAIDARTLAPARCTDVYAGAPVLITGRYVGKASPSARVRLRGVQFGAEFVQSVAQQPERQTFLERYALSSVWARARLRDLEDRYAAGGQSHPVRDEMEQEMVRVSTTFSVLCRFTAFVAVDRSEVANRTGYQQRVIQAVEEKAKSEAGMLRGRAITTPQNSYPISAPMAASMPVPGSMPSAPMAASPRQYSAVPAAPSASMAKRGVSYEADDGDFAVSSAPSAFEMEESAPAPMRKSTRPAPAKVAAPSAPPRLSSIPVMHSMAEPALDRGRSQSGQVSPAQLARLREIATALSVALPRQQIMALRVEVTRLREWTEDAASTMVAAQLVRTIEAIVVELERLLRAPSLDEQAFAAGIASIGDAANAAGGNAGPGPAPAPTRKPFWKRNR
jgi:Ca-activated chloride channel family protein